jgi:hypothetical protein
MLAQGQRGPDLRFGDEGELTPCDEKARAAIGLRSGLWKIAGRGGNGVLVLERVNGEEGQDRTVLAGELEAGALLEVVGMLQTTEKSGTLTVVSGETCKALRFERGQVVSALSSCEEDSLGALLVRRGRIEARDLTLALAVPGGSRRVGRALVEQGLLSAQELWSFLRSQIQEIFFSLATLDQGSFYFSVPGQPEQFPTYLPMSPQALLIESARRMDELFALRRLIPDLSMVVEPVAALPQGLELGPEEQHLLRTARHPMTLRELGRRARMGEYEFLRAIRALLQANVLVSAQERPPAGPLRSSERHLETLIDAYNQAFQEIHASVQPAEERARLLQGVQAFLSSYSYPDLFRRVPVDDDGGLSKGALLANLAAVAEKSKPSYLCAGLSELLYFEIHLARASLGRDGETQLQGRLKALLGRATKGGNGS